MREVDGAWAAGLFEGEGSVRIAPSTHRNSGTLVVDVPNTDREIVAFFAERWGGKMRHVPAKGGRREYWRWRVYSAEAAAFLVEVQAFVRTARVRGRIALALEFQAQKARRGFYTREYRVRQRDYYWRMRVLNHRGTGPPPERPDGWDRVVEAPAQRCGEANPRAKLTWGAVRAIRERAAAGETGVSLAREFDVSAALASRIIRGESWQEP